MEPFIGEIRIFSFHFAPKGWAQCNGQLMPINQNQALFALLGVTYGGDGRTTFGLPDLRGRVPVHTSTNLYLGERGGSEYHTLNMSEMPSHTHSVAASSMLATSRNPEGLIWANTDVEAYGTNSLIGLHPSAITSVGGGHPHENRQPYRVVNYCIAIQGIFPSYN
ncbi:tail fiber protein [Ammoniphilus sp. CFH 90114]|uniref:phage tail protein n=1 Tax=Ammoniphilus sp. CFH 90114 TaxID=2493665 RepID=UPI00196A1E19